MGDNKIEVKVMMFGGRRCGKTSVLAAMQSCFEDKFGRGNLMIRTNDNKMLLKLRDKRNEISSYFYNQGKSRSFVPDSNPTEDMTEYRFHIGLKNKKTAGIVVNFIDYPGEWLNRSDKLDELSEIMQHVHIIIIAIDAPHLMEQTGSDDDDAVGQFNDNRNYSWHIGEWVKSNFSTQGNLAAKMVLFVPLKCEKYYHNGQMDILNKKIHSAYRETFNFFTNNNSQKYEVAITPILTCGDEDAGVEFDRFERDPETQEIKIDPKYGTPQKALYIFTKKMSQPKPIYCEQPMVYTLAYVLSMVRIVMEQDKKDEGFFKGIMRFINETFFNAASVQDFMEEQQQIFETMKRIEHGYEIYSNPLNF